jgi:hypothetical protein
MFIGLETVSKIRRFCDATDIIKNETEELKRLSQNYVFSTFTVAGRCVYLKKGTILREM